MALKSQQITPLSLTLSYSNTNLSLRSNIKTFRREIVLRLPIIINCLVMAAPLGAIFDQPYMNIPSSSHSLFTNGLNLDRCKKHKNSHFIYMMY